MTAKLSLYVTAIMLVAILTVGVGCTKAPNDAQLASDIQTKLASDSGLQGKQLGVKAEAGTVTLTGTVDNEAQRDAAARYASSEPGVKQIINNLQVAPPPPAQPADAGLVCAYLPDAGLCSQARHAVWKSFDQRRHCGSF